MSISESLHGIFAIAMFAHAGQKRRDGSDYIDHPVRVAEFLSNRYFYEIPSFDSYPHNAYITIGAAYLHDVLEDTKETYQSLRDKGVSEDILDIVNLLTKSPDVEYTSYIRLIAANPIAKLIKIADILDNLSDAPSAKQIDKYAKALKILHGVDFGTNLKNLRENQPKVSQQEAYAQMEKHLSDSEKIHSK